MITAVALEQMTDRGKFELLATAVIGVERPEYRPIIHLGVNAKGETVRASIDGFCCFGSKHY